MPGSTTTSLKLPPAMRDRVQRLAQALRRTPHWILREAIEEYVAREESREQARQDALAAWEEFQVHGQHATAEDVDAWLAKLEAGVDIDPPECHS